MNRIARPVLLALACLAAACGGSGEEAASAPVSDLPERYLLEAGPAGARDVGAVHADAKEGEEVLVRGVVGGAPDVFVEGLAAFTLVDPALRSCAGDGMDCATPWDYCCVDPAALAENSVTVELREGERPLRASPRGFHGLDHLKTVLVRGVVERDARGNVTIVATGLRVL